MLFDMNCELATFVPFQSILYEKSIRILYFKVQSSWIIGVGPAEIELNSKSSIHSNTKTFYPAAIDLTLCGPIIRPSIIENPSKRLHSVLFDGQMKLELFLLPSRD